MKPRFAVEAHLSELFPGEVPQCADYPKPERLPVDLPQSALEDLAEANTARHDWIAAEGRQDRGTTRGGYTRVSDYRASRTDPDASLVQLRRGTRLGYHVNYAADGGRARIILQVLTTPGEVMENTPMLDLLWRCSFRWKLSPKQVTGDTTYGTVENIVAVEDEGIRAYVPLPDFDKRTELSARVSSATMRTGTRTCVRRARYCASTTTCTPSASASTKATRLPAMPAPSKRDARRAPTVVT